MAGATIPLTLSNMGRVHDPVSLNNLFDQVAAVINGKMDKDSEAQTLSSDLTLNQQPIINVAKSENPNDAVTVLEMKQAVAAAPQPPALELPWPLADDDPAPVGSPDPAPDFSSFRTNPDLDDGGVTCRKAGKVLASVSNPTDGLGSLFSRDSNVEEAINNFIIIMHDYLEQYLDKSGGDYAMQSPLDAGMNKITDLPTPQSEGDLITREFLEDYTS